MGRITGISYARLVTRLYTWLQNHPTLVDGVMAAVLVFFGAVSIFERNSAVASVAGVFIGAPLLFRRNYTVAAFWAVMALGAVQVFFGHRPSVSDFAVPMAIYALAAYRPRRVSLIGLALGLIGSLAVLLFWVRPAARQSATVIEWLLMFGLLASPTII